MPVCKNNHNFIQCLASVSALPFHFPMLTTQRGRRAGHLSDGTGFRTGSQVSEGPHGDPRGYLQDTWDVPGWALPLCVQAAGRGLVPGISATLRVCGYSPGKTGHLRNRWVPTWGWTQGRPLAEKARAVPPPGVNMDVPRSTKFPKCLVRERWLARLRFPQ